MGSAVRPQLLLPLHNRAVFLEQVFAKGEQGGLFVPGEVDVALGEEVDVELHFVAEDVRFHIRALVKWKRGPTGRRSLPPGIGIEFLASDRRTQDQLVRFAEGRESVSHVARDSRRFALQVDVRIKGAAGELSGTTDDISEGGCFVLTDVNLDVGTALDLKLRSVGSLFGWLTVPAVVAWRREQSGRDGMGLQFQFGSDRVRRKVRKIVALLKERNVRELQILTPRTASSPPVKV
jgi:Tfp pilus assembly protein PilZ